MKVGNALAGPGDQSCRFCRARLHHLVVDLGMSPLCQSFLDANQLHQMEPFYPLRLYVCERCLLVQLLAYVDGRQIFGGDYAYFSSYSDSWLAHAARYVDAMVEKFSLGPESQVVEVGSNDGYLLQYFAGKGIEATGIEPARNVARAAEAKGVRSLREFLGETTAQRMAAEGLRADLLIGNNVLAHQPDLNDFVIGLRTLLAPGGVLTMEFPHLVHLIEQNQFDTIYQEHYCYFTLSSVAPIFAHHGMTVFDVESLPTHGGSLRIYVKHTADESKSVQPVVARMRDEEIAAGYDRVETYTSYAERVAETKRQLLEFLIRAKRDGKRIAAYGAPGKGNTLLNYCGIRGDFLDFAVDRNPYKQGRFLPGTHVPVVPPEEIDRARPDYILILPWNLKEEIMGQLAYVRDWGARFVVPIPELQVV